MSTPTPIPGLTAPSVAIPPEGEAEFRWAFPERIAFWGIHDLYPGLVVCELLAGTLRLIASHGQPLDGPVRSIYFLPYQLSVNEPVLLRLRNVSAHTIEVAPMLAARRVGFEFDGAK